jgi:hypothetical protein
MSETNHLSSPTSDSDRLSGVKLFLIITGAVACALLLALAAARYILFPQELVPVSLSAKEQRQLEDKLSRLPESAGNISDGTERRLEPEPYSETGASREIVFSERELNGLIAREPELARRFAIDLSDGMASGKLLVPLDPEFPLLGGKTLKVTAGLQLAYTKGKPVVILKGVSIWDVPIPNAWLGNLKNVDLVKEFGGQEGFWSVFADGVEEILVEDGQLLLRLKE